MKKTSLLIATFILISSHLFSQACSENYTLDWNDHLTVLSGWPVGATSYSLTETDGNPSSVNIDFTVTGDTSILVKGSESPTGVSVPFTTSQFYQNEGCLIISGEASEMQFQRICNTNDYILRTCFKLVL